MIYDDNMNDINHDDDSVQDRFCAPKFGWRLKLIYVSQAMMLVLAFVVLPFWHMVKIIIEMGLWK